MGSRASSSRQTTSLSTIALVPVAIGKVSV